MSHPILIVGASAAGLSAAETLRAQGFKGPLTIVGEEPYQPYDRPPLSKQLLSGQWDKDKVSLRDSQALQALNAHWHLGRRAQSLSLQQRVVRLDDGAALHYEQLLIATGVQPRRLPGCELAGAFLVRTLDDAMALRTAAAHARRILVVGGGFLGTEVAGTLRQAGLEVVLAYAEGEPLERVCGAQIGALVAQLHREHGVLLRPGSAVVGLEGTNGRVRAAVFADGTPCPADVIVVAIGSVPATGWLEGSGLSLQDGVVCDASCRAADGVYAAGDVARWWHPTLERTIRLEHRMNATEQAMVAARNMLGDSLVHAPIPYAWSDQFDQRLQFYGSFPPDAYVELMTLPGQPRKCTAVYRRHGVPVGLMGWNAPRELRALRPMLGGTVAA